MMRNRGSLARITAALVVLLSVIAVMSGGASAQDSLPEPSTTIRVMHVAEGGPNADISVDGEVRYSGLSYGEATNYDSVPPGEHTFQVDFAADAGLEPISVTQTVEPGKAAIVLVANGDSGPEIRSYEVNLDRTADATARVRLINATSDSGDLDVYGEYDRWFKDVGTGSASDYKEVQYGPRDITVRSDDSDQPLVNLPELIAQLGHGVRHGHVRHAWPMAPCKQSC